MYTLILHIANQEAIKVDVEEIPKPTDQVIVGINPRDRKDKDLVWVEEGVTTIIMPWWRLNYVQVLPGAEQKDTFPELFRN